MKERKMPPEGDAVLWSVADVAAYFGASRSWVYAITASGRLPSIKIGTLRRFIPRAVKEWAEGRTADGQGGGQGQSGTATEG